RGSAGEGVPANRPKGPGKPNDGFAPRAHAAPVSAPALERGGPLLAKGGIYRRDHRLSNLGPTRGRSTQRQSWSSASVKNTRMRPSSGRPRGGGAGSSQAGFTRARNSRATAVAR